MQIVMIVDCWYVLVQVGYISCNLSTRCRLVLNFVWSSWQETLMWWGRQNSVIGVGVLEVGLHSQQRQQTFEFK
jgi:hypothetical protein